MGVSVEISGFQSSGGTRFTGPRVFLLSIVEPAPGKEEPVGVRDEGSSENPTRVGHEECVLQNRLGWEGGDDPESPGRPYRRRESPRPEEGVSRVSGHKPVQMMSGNVSPRFLVLIFRVETPRRVRLGSGPTPGSRGSVSQRGFVCSSRLEYTRGVPSVDGPISLKSPCLAERMGL